VPLANVDDEATNDGWLHLCPCPMCNQSAALYATLEMWWGWGNVWHALFLNHRTCKAICAYTA
jgi:hypothetical protein